MNCWKSFACAALLCGLVAVPASASRIEGQLDERLATGDWIGLDKILKDTGGSGRTDKITWIGRRIDAGGSFYFARRGSTLLWAEAEARPQPESDDPAKDLRLAAGEMTLYTFALIFVDGQACRSNVAASQYEDALMANVVAMRDLIKRPEAVRHAVVDRVVALEKKTASQRVARDSLLCQGRGPAKPPEEGDPGFRPEAQFKPDQENMRAQLPEMLFKLTDIKGVK